MERQNQSGLAGWQKWALITAIVGGLSAVVLYFNYRVFGWDDGLPYGAVVLFLCLIAFITTLHIKRGRATTSFLKAAFTFEVLTCLVLGINAAYSLSVQRGMSVAGMAEAQRATDLGTIAKLRGSRTQREAVKRVGVEPLKTRQQVFAENERVLFWILILELAIGITATFVLLGLSVFDTNRNGVPDFLEEEEAFDEFVDPALEAEAGKNSRRR